MVTVTERAAGHDLTVDPQHREVADWVSPQTPHLSGRAVGENDQEVSAVRDDMLVSDNPGIVSCEEPGSRVDFIGGVVADSLRLFQLTTVTTVGATRTTASMT